MTDGNDDCRRPTDKSAARAASRIAQTADLDDGRRRGNQNRMLHPGRPPGGAKVITDVALDVRDGFQLALVPEHTTRQSCEVVWRRGKTYGVKFLP